MPYTVVITGTAINMANVGDVGPLPLIKGFHELLELLTVASGVLVTGVLLSCISLTGKSLEGDEDTPFS
jgi:hypothetical protein